MRLQGWALRRSRQQASLLGHSWRKQVCNRVELDLGHCGALFFEDFLVVIICNSLPAYLRPAPTAYDARSIARQAMPSRPVHLISGVLFGWLLAKTLFRNHRHNSLRHRKTAAGIREVSTWLQDIILSNATKYQLLCSKVNAGARQA
jgi:hypothetical protein